jgi:hypothetical protein
MDQCNPRSLNIISPATQLVITISQTFDGQPPYRVVLDLQGYYISTVSRKHPLLIETIINLFFFSQIPVIPTQPSVAAVTPVSEFPMTKYIYIFVKLTMTVFMPVGIQPVNR